MNAGGGAVSIHPVHHAIEKGVGRIIRHTPQGEKRGHECPLRLFALEQRIDVHPAAFAADSGAKSGPVFKRLFQKFTVVLLDRGIHGPVDAHFCHLPRPERLLLGDRQTHVLRNDAVHRVHNHSQHGDEPDDHDQRRAGHGMAVCVDAGGERGHGGIGKGAFDG